MPGRARSALMLLLDSLIPWAKAAKPSLVYVASGKAQSQLPPHPFRVHSHSVSQRASRKEPRTGGCFVLCLFPCRWFAFVSITAPRTSSCFTSLCGLSMHVSLISMSLSWSSITGMTWHLRERCAAPPTSLLGVLFSDLLWLFRALQLSHGS